ncbi:helix-turn-helix domain-containing protein [Sphingomonas sp.]|uniref:helix-turn-helix transcriptional regulator n=1 Tax=Sphingomonas sp. TaxID=28214 RepID=UPI003D6D381D
MGVMARVQGDFSVSDLVREAAAQSLPLPATPEASVIVDSPIMSGMVIAEDVQPGLTLSAREITYRDEGLFDVRVDRMLMCGLLLSGDTEPLEVPGHPAILHSAERLTLIGFGDPSSCRRSCRAGQSNRAFAILLTPAFFDRFGDTVADEGLVALRGLLDPGFHVRSLAAPRPIVALANDVFDRDYTGPLRTLFHESVALRYLLEITGQLRDETRLVGRIGRRSYDRVYGAREILDSAMVDPPETLDLARQLGTNVTTLQASFKAAFGTTIFGYVRQRRLEMGRALIEEHGLGVADSGFRVGFTNPAAFTAAYRRHFGEAPTRRRDTRSH